MDKNDIDGELTEIEKAEINQIQQQAVVDFKDAEAKGKAWDTKDNVAVNFDQIIDRIAKRQKVLLDKTIKLP